MNAPPISAQRFIGQRVPRKEDGRLLTGRGSFVDDIILPGMLHADGARPDEAAMTQAMSGHLCRCTGYQGIRRAIRQLAAEDGTP